MDSYNVVATGRLLAGFAQQDVVTKLAELFNQPPERVNALLQGRRIVVRRRIDHAGADEYVRRLTAIGLECISERDILDIEPDALSPGTTMHAEPPPIPPQYARPSPQPIASAETSGISDELWNSVAQTRASYYVQRWKRYAAGQTPFPSWHWPAFFASVFWALYRKSWAGAVGFFVLPIVISFFYGIVAAIIGDGHDAGTGLLALAGLVAVWATPPMLANGFYYRKARKLIGEAQRLSPDTNAQVAFLTAKGGTSGIGLVLGVFFGGIFGIGILAAIALPAYRDYVVRAKVSEALAAVGPLKVQVVESVRAKRMLPDLDFRDVRGAPGAVYLTNVSMNEEGRLTVTFALEPVSGKQLVLRPYLDSNDAISWACETVDMPEKYLPGSCRSK